MSNAHDKYFEPIKELLTNNSSLGVNAIARELDVPVSTIQKWLERQNYFVKNDRRQWELPGESKGSVPTLKGSIQNVLEGQARSIEHLTELLVNQLRMTVNFANSYNIQPQEGVTTVIEVKTESPVADVDPRLIQLEVDAKKLIDIFNKKDIKANIPEAYRELLNNYDHVGLIIKEGTGFATKFLEDEIFSLLAGRINILSEETVEILKENQKNAV